MKASPERVPLYSKASHTTARIMIVGFVSFVILGIPFALIDFMQKPTWLPLPAMVIFFAILWGAARGILRARRIFGQADGLVVRDPGAWRTIPWSKVGPVECPVSSFNPVLRIYYVEVAGEPSRIHFFAGRREVERLEKLRAEATG